MLDCFLDFVQLHSIRVMNKQRSLSVHQLSIRPVRQERKEKETASQNQLATFSQILLCIWEKIDNNSLNNLTFLIQREQNKNISYVLLIQKHIHIISNNYFVSN